MERILSIDPGTTQSAFVLYDGNHLHSKGIMSNSDVMTIIARAPSNTIVAIEMVASYGMPVGKDIFETVVWIGRFLEHSISMCHKVTRVYRKDVKMHLCYSMRAKDSNIRQALIDKYGKPGTKKEPNEFYNDSEVKMSKDIWSALAILDYIKSQNIHSIPLEV